MTKQNKWWGVDELKIILAAVVLAFGVRTMVAQSYSIPSGSMQNTLLIGDHVFVNKLYTTFGNPHHGDIIVFKSPVEENRNLIKRVIAISGDRVEMRGDTLYLNGEPQIESYAIYERNNGLGRATHYRFGPVIVPEGHIFVMGDNRNNSGDSRFFGPVQIDNIQGKAMVAHWSWINQSYGVRWDRIGTLLY